MEKTINKTANLSIPFIRHRFLVLKILMQTKTITYHQIVTIKISKNRNNLKNFRKKKSQKIAKRNYLVVGTVVLKFIKKSLKIHYSLIISVKNTNINTVNRCLHLEQKNWCKIWVECTHCVKNFSVKQLIEKCVKTQTNVC